MVNQCPSLAVPTIHQSSQHFMVAVAFRALCRGLLLRLSFQITMIIISSRDWFSQLKRFKFDRIVKGCFDAPSTEKPSVQINQALDGGFQPIKLNENTNCLIVTNSMHLKQIPKYTVRKNDYANQ